MNQNQIIESLRISRDNNLDTIQRLKDEIFALTADNVKLKSVSIALERSKV